MPDRSDVSITMVVAVAENGVIGRGGELPWRLSSDLKRFRSLTMGKPLIMGRKTYDSIGNPLDGRDNIVVTRNKDFSATGIYVAADLEKALDLACDLAAERGVKEIAVIGGAEIYNQALPVTDSIQLTEVHASPEGDTCFPTLSEGEWNEISRERHTASPRDSADYSYVVLERVR